MKDYTFFCRTSEKYFMLGNRFDVELQRLAVHHIKPGDVVYDVGAYAGYTTLLFSALVGGGGSVFAFEPSPLNHIRLRSNLDVNRKANVTLVNAAVSDHEGNALLEENGSMSSIASDAIGARVSKVTTLRLDDFVYRDGNPPPSFVKLDVEGFAGPIFEGMGRVLETRGPMILCELHDEQEEEHVRRILVRCNYRLSPLEPKRKFPWQMFARPNGPQ
jgi:FkbM family methyltransferase